MDSISRCFWSTSKKPPQVAGALLDVLDVRKGFGSNHVVPKLGRQRAAASGKSKPTPLDAKKPSEVPDGWKNGA